LPYLKVADHFLFMEFEKSTQYFGIVQKCSHGLGID